MARGHSRGQIEHQSSGQKNCFFPSLSSYPQIPLGNGHMNYSLIYIFQALKCFLVSNFYVVLGNEPGNWIPLVPIKIVPIQASQPNNF